MKINRPARIPLVNPYQPKAYSATEKQASSAKRDQLQISSEAQSMLVERLNQAEHGAEVERLKAEIEAGTYERDSRKVAEKLYQFWFEQ